jgi:hypothetical protein
MADINIERKSGAGNVLPWIIGLLVLALLAWWLLAGRGDDRRVGDGTHTDTLTVQDPRVGQPMVDPADVPDGATGTGVGTGTGTTTTTPP